LAPLPVMMPQPFKLSDEPVTATAFVCAAAAATTAATPFQFSRLRIRLTVTRQEITCDSARSGRAQSGTDLGGNVCTLPEQSIACQDTDALRLTVKGGKGLAAFWRKAGLVHGTTMTTDGVCVANDGQGGVLQIVLSGLSPGHHNQ
jgi:hypothetical protein